MHRTIALVTLVSLAACAAGPAYVTRESGAFPPTVSVERAEAECRLEGQKAAAPVADFGTKVAISRATYSACLESKGYQMVEAGSP